MDESTRCGRATDTSPVQFARHEMASLRVGRRTVSEVDANWKILVENSMECLHCPNVHPELVDVIPFYRNGSVTDTARSDGGVALLSGGSGFTPGGQSELPILRSMTATGVEDHSASPCSRT
ncbi:MAG: SRPBCC family protein [Ilumatobacteraceae bacterium]